MSLKGILRLLTPPLLSHLIRQLKSKEQPTTTYGLQGNYASWADALAVSTGYDSATILEKTKTSLLKVKNGEAVYERDSVLFNKVEYAWPLLASLMWVAANCEGKLNVLDFGGSLGSSYYQNQEFISTLPDIRWNVIEQSRHVEVGKAWFEDSYLHFYPNIADCLAATQPNVVLLSGVLQYLERPYVVLEQILQLPCNYIVIDRTPFWGGPTDQLCVQNVPPIIYEASYPSWVFSKQYFDNHLSNEWRVMVAFDNPDRIPGPIEFTYQGAIIVRQKKLS